MLVYVTGVPGSGKSAVCAELARRGYDARDADRGISAWCRIIDGTEVPTPSARGYRVPDWYARFEWRFSVERTAAFAEEVNDGVGFLCGVGVNEEEIWHLLSYAFFLDLDWAALRERVAGRTGNDAFGKTDYELQRILDWHSAIAEHCRTLGIESVDAMRPVGEVVDDLLCRCGVTPSDR